MLWIVCVLRDSCIIVTYLVCMYDGLSRRRHIAWMDDEMEKIPSDALRRGGYRFKLSANSWSWETKPKFGSAIGRRAFK